MGVRNSCASGRLHRRLSATGGPKTATGDGSPCRRPAGSAQPCCDAGGDGLMDVHFIGIPINGVRASLTRIHRRDGSVLVRLGIRGHGNGRHGFDPDRSGLVRSVAATSRGLLTGRGGDVERDHQVARHDRHSEPDRAQICWAVGQCDDGTGTDGVDVRKVEAGRVVSTVRC